MLYDNQPRVLFLVVLMGAAIEASPATRAGDQAAAQQPPNILFVLADDLGMEAVGAYGGQSYETPNIDRLAQQGLRFTRCFSNPLCAPSRGELLTGRYPHHNGVPRNIYDFREHESYVDPNQQPSFARQLEQAGYATAVAGKWQLSFLHQRDTPPALGFHQYMLWQLFDDQGEKTRRYYKPHFRENGEVIADKIAGRYGPDVLCDFLIDFMEDNRDGPFMAYYTALLPHWPWVPTPHSADQQVPHLGQNRHGDPKFHPDMINYLDHNVGRLLSALERLDIAKNTIVVFSGDNGVDMHRTSQWRGLSVPGGKGTMTDRGTRVPLIVRWPKHIEGGATTARMVEFADMLPTFCDLGGAPRPERRIDGRSFAPLLRQRSLEPKGWVHWHQSPTKRAIRTARWVIPAKGRPKAAHPYPFDATPINPSALDKSARQTINKLKRQTHDD